MAQVSAMSLVILLIAALLLSVRSFRPFPSNHGDEELEEDSDYTPVFGNKVYPQFNPCEAQPYFTLPFCPPGKPVQKRKKSLLEIIEGDCFTKTQYKLKFKVEKLWEPLCEKNLTRNEVAKFRNAITNKLEYQMFYNDIEIRGKVGEYTLSRASSIVPEYGHFLFKHIEFHAYYIGDKVDAIYIKSDLDYIADVSNDDENKVKFTYSVFWKEQTSSLNGNKTAFDEDGLPIEKERELGFIEIVLSRISIAFVWIYLLLKAIVPYLKSYLSRKGGVRESRRRISLRQIHGEDCRCPPYSSLLGAFLGIGTQHLILICTLFVLAYKKVLYPCNYEALCTYVFVIYCLTSSVSGFIATSFHSKYTEARWKECIFQTGVLYFVPTLITFLFVNILGLASFGDSDLPKLSITKTLLSWGLGGVTLLCLGGIIGFYSRPKSKPPCSTSKIPRVVPKLCWYLKTPVQIFLGGLLPFLTVFLDMDNFYASLWNRKVCGTFRTLLIDFVVVVAATVGVGMGFTHVQLSNHDQNWSWRAVLRGGSPAIFMYIYGIYFHDQINQKEVLFPVFFMCYNACIFYAFFMVLGTIGFIASSYIFRRTYKEALKDE